MSNGVRYTPTFAMPTEYERAAMEARRRQRMAEMLAQQEFNPANFPNAPISSAYPIARALKGFLSGREEALAEKAALEAKSIESDYAKRLAGRMGGVSELPDYGTPEQQMARIDAEEAAQRASGQLQEVTPTAQYRFNPQEALDMASTEVGTAALKNRPLMAQRLAKMLETPEGEEFYAPTETEQGLVQFGKRGGKKETGYKKPPEVKAPATHGNLQWNAETKSWEQIPGYKPPPGVTVDLGKKGNEQWQGAIIDEIVKARPKATAANNIIQAVDQMDELTSAGTYTGTLAPGAIGASQFLNSFGLNVDPNTLSNSRAFEAAVNDLVLTVQSALGGARGFTREETAILINAFPKIVDDPQSRKIIGDLIRKKQRDVISEYNSLINDYEEAFPETRSPYKRLETEDERYQRWKNSQNAAGVPR